MQRREFIVGFGITAMWPLAGRAEQRAAHTIGYLSSRSAVSDVSMVRALRRGLNDVGFMESQNVAVEFRLANGEYERLAALATDW
jgi:putative tryptophan/tyrosine transport system substrate-binding protein